MALKDALSDEEVETRLKHLPQWKKEERALVRVQTFPNYKDALDFVYQVGLAAEEHNHHPDITMNFKRVAVKYWTHTARGISALDFQLAEVVEALVGRYYKPR